MAGCRVHVSMGPCVNNLAVWCDLKSKERQSDSAPTATRPAMLVRLVQSLLRCESSPSGPEVQLREDLRKSLESSYGHGLTPCEHGVQVCIPQMLKL